MNLNKVYLIGRLTQDPETRSTTSGQSVTTLKMATNRVWKDPSGGRKDATEYHTVIAWSRLGEIASQYLKKGGLIMIEGRLQTRNWTGKDNVKRYVTEIVAESLQMGPKAMGGQGGYSAEVSDIKKSSPAPIKDSDIPIIDADEPMNSGVEEDEMSIKESDLPF
ncbi:MAG: Single-stranded DNA-binding protein [Candidatus Gottesmanbacteria bacterium GW2011_GWA2_47_9]|uniref:Single-stranded DNA-binding protein n=2 Tax=Patescibacteria group TaxID=1783273 RepID=A0A0G1WU27_9BACT|nr:MAG: Single-stranded DNA-binding protein [Candidatus Yanofskybacteria bacterium GW2011_GWA1_39_13]KKU85655.1 MAG: Single-stranded DNA-binding protein [Candidatus Gottesmanbacteria bacterium GW2011_GWA2_47_9]